MKARHSAVRPTIQKGHPMTISPIDFTVRGIAYKLAILDDGDIDLDPTLLIFRELEEEAIVTLHLNPGAPCRSEGHLVAREAED
jgi:hypothetical protein